MTPSLQERLTGIPTPEGGRHPLAIFHDDLAVAQMNGPDEADDSPLPIIEAPRVVIEYLNRGAEKLKAFDKAGYMVMQNVIVCEVGKKAAVIESLNRSLDDFTHVAGGSSGAPKK